MSTIKTDEVTFEGSGSHHVALNRGPDNLREEVYLYFFATWRGDPVRVTMSCDRYTVSDSDPDVPDRHLTEWRIFAQDARVWDENSGRGPHVTDLARSRLSDALKPLAAEWLTSDNYVTSEQNAYTRAIGRLLTDGYNRSDRTRRAKHDYRDKLRDEQAAAITSAIIAYDAYQSALEQVSETCK